MNHLYKYLSVSFLILMSGMLFAQNGECLVIEASYSLTVSGTSRITGEAVVESQDKAFHMVGNGIEAFCDGVDIWTIDQKVKEVYVEALTSESGAAMKDIAPQLAAMKAGSEADFDLPDGMKIHIKITSIKRTDGKDVSSFRPPYEFDSSWVVTDLR